MVFGVVWRGVAWYVVLRFTSLRFAFGVWVGWRADVDRMDSVEMVGWFGVCIHVCVHSVEGRVCGSVLSDVCVCAVLCCAVL